MSSPDKFAEEFQRIAGCDHSTAIDYLIRSEYDIDRAIGLFFDDRNSPNRTLDVNLTSNSTRVMSNVNSNDFGSVRESDAVQISATFRLNENFPPTILAADGNDEMQRFKRVAEQNLRTTTDTIRVEIEFRSNDALPNIEIEIDRNRTLSEIRRVFQQNSPRFRHNEFVFVLLNQTDISREEEEQTLVESHIFILC